MKRILINSAIGSLLGFVLFLIPFMWYVHIHNRNDVNTTTTNVNLYEKGLQDGKFIGRNAVLLYLSSQSKDTLKVDICYLLQVEDSIEKSIKCKE